MLKTKLALLDPTDMFKDILKEILKKHEAFDVSFLKTQKEAQHFLQTRGKKILIINEPSPAVKKMLQPYGAEIILLTTQGSSKTTPFTCLSKPFSLETFIQTLHQKNHQLSYPAQMTLGPYTLDSIQKKLIQTKTKKSFKLTEKEIAILMDLYEAPNHQKDKQTLLHDIWGYGEGITTHTLETHVYRLRQKIEKDPTQPKIFMTNKDGYQLKI